MLFPGAKVTPDGLKVLEYNGRPGDPETQTYMRLLETSMLDIAVAALAHRLGDLELKWREGVAACIVNAAPGYPGEYTKGIPISGIDKVEAADSVIKVFQAGTKREGDQLVSSGGRVLGVTAVGENLHAALEHAYEASAGIEMPGKRVRMDIGQRTPPETVVL